MTERVSVPVLVALSVVVTVSVFAPSARVTVFDQLVVPVAVPLPALAPDTDTEAIPVPPVSVAVPEIVYEAVEEVAAEVISAVGSVVSRVTVMESLAVLPQLSVAVTERTLSPSASDTERDQVVVPVVPDPALTLPKPEVASEAVPVNVYEELLVLVLDEVIATVGSVGS